ncbi:MAG TPA: hypothetical protein VJX92_23870 [Methylomirabilota bacterium]|nr:hypothetical protein [Methylomirabilota bacterium]
MIRAAVGAVVGAGLLGCVLTPPAGAQGPVEIRATAPEKPPQLRIVEPGPATREATRPSEAPFYREDVRVRHEPAFIEPFVTQTPGGTKWGLSGWTAPTTPVGSLSALQPWGGSGSVALGITVVWDAAPLTAASRVSNPR